MNTPETAPDLKSIRQDIDFYKIFKVFLSRWYWILGCVIVALVIAYVNLLYTPKIFQTYGQLKLQDQSPNISTTQGLSSQSYSYTDRIQAEGFVIRSNEVLLNAISNIDYKISYFVKGRLRTSDIYPTKPFSIAILQQDSVLFSKATYFVESINSASFSLISEDNPKGKKKEYRYHEAIKLGNMSFKITSPIPSGGTYGFRFNTMDDFLGRLGGLNTQEAGRFTNIMGVSLTDENPFFAADMLNSIMKEYVKADIKQKKRSARQTVEF
ncbi:MAG: Wzz/FepE/Etk N-terminal domain-containing protein, partial [Bacteroidia bacterium]